MGRPACMAILNGPRLKAIMRPSEERPPSGKVITELPSSSDLTVRLNVSSCDRRDSVCSGM